MNEIKDMKHYANIVPLTEEHLPFYANVIRVSFAPVAHLLELTQENCPLHPAFVTNKRLQEKIKKGYFPFGYFLNGKLVGFVSLTDKGDGMFEMNDLAVLPGYRRVGIGRALVDFCKMKTAELGGRYISIEIVNENTGLQQWYTSQEFVYTHSKKHGNLPISFGYMECKASARGKISPLSPLQIPFYGDVIRESFATAARAHKLTRENCPTHNHFITNAKLTEIYGENYYPFGFIFHGDLIGFVSLANKGSGTFEMNMLCILPKHRHMGFGTELLIFCKNKVVELGGKKIEISLWENSTRLMNWYTANGFVFRESKSFAHMPFPVTYMDWMVPQEI